MTSLVTLTTDFGTSSGYVAQMKGRFFKALCQEMSGETSPLADCQLIDLAHDIPEHDIRSAAWFAATSCFSFPPQTLHLMVVDPGVGTSRQIIYVEMGDQRFLVPNNGLLSLSARQHPPTAIHPVQTTHPVSKTFHGRDIFAPTAAQIVLGRTSCLGPAISELLSPFLARTKRNSEVCRWGDCSYRPLRQPYYKPARRTHSGSSRQGSPKLQWNTHQSHSLNIRRS